MTNKVISQTMGMLMLLSISCQTTDETTSSSSYKNKKNTPKIFEKLNPNQTNIHFNNQLTEDSIINYFTYPYIYMGGGVAIGDLNNDDLADIYFTGNMVDNQLYINKGNLQFEEQTQKAKVSGDQRWVTGVTLADVNADGWLDIYVSVSGKFGTTQNQLFINQGADKEGIPQFTEEAETRGLADEGQSTQATFFDYDRDGDLDVYVANYPFTGFKTPNHTYYYKMNDPTLEDSDKLYANDGKGFFKEVTEQAGLLNFGLSLSASVADFNNDGWLDIYVSNDFASPDLFYINNRDGTFTNKIKRSFQHTSFFGMGSDAADLNNDGLIDLIQMDMTPADNRRNKANMASMNMNSFWEIVNFGMHHQYMFNSVQINQGVGIGKKGLPHFSDVAQFTGMASTDWSWAALCADFDNNGYKDVFITNGTRRDINNKDYFGQIKKATYKEKQQFTNLDLTLNMPSEKVDNYMFKNSGDLNFENSTYNWGLNEKGFSNGAAYADLDNDGDLDLVVNNIDAPASIFKNTTVDQNLGNYLKIKLKGSAKNPFGIGAKVSLQTNAGQQVQEQILTRGFQSSIEPVLHFGLDTLTAIHFISVVWPDGQQQQIDNPKINSRLILNYTESGAVAKSNKKNIETEKWFTDITQQSGIDFVHQENNYNDFLYEVLLPHTYSKNGPALAVSDINNDGLDDFFVGGASGYVGQFFLQQSNHTFTAIENDILQKDILKEDVAATFFDADNDKDLDLYVVSGSNEFEEGSPQLQDRLYLNNGLGLFEKATDALPNMSTSGSTVKVADFDKDGDLDLFVGGRIVPKQYPLAAKSYLLQNEGVVSGYPSFIDATEKVAPALMEAGMVTDAVWVDFNKDEKPDLVIVGEWMPITFLKNTGSTFKEVTAQLGLQNTVGWWYSIIADDFDKDGYPDFVVGNLGLNYKYKASPNATFDVYANDFDKNGQHDIVLGYYDDKGVQYPVRGKQCSAEQIPTINIKYKNYNTFAEASLADIYHEPDLEAGLHYQAQQFASVYIHNKHGKNFELQPLPTEAQLSSVNAIIAKDINLDNHLDLILAGNLFGAEVETPRNDASYGVVLAGDGKGNFTNLPFSKTGLKLGKDTKAMLPIKVSGNFGLLVANNSDTLQLILKLSNR